MENDVLAADPFGGLSYDVESDGGGNLEPCLAGCHACGHVGAAYACGEGSQSAVGAGVGVCADDAVACYGESLFRKESVLDAHLSYVEVVAYFMFAGKFTDAFAVFGGFDVFVGDKMIHYQGNFILVEYFFAVHFFHLADGYRCCDVIAKNQIEICFDKLSGLYF